MLQRPPAQGSFNQSQCFQDLQGLSDRGPAHPEPTAELMLGGESSPVLQAPLNDKLADFIDYLLDNGASFDRLQHGRYYMYMSDI